MEYLAIQTWGKENNLRHLDIMMFWCLIVYLLISLTTLLRGLWLNALVSVTFIIMNRQYFPWINIEYGRKCDKYHLFSFIPTDVNKKFQMICVSLKIKPTLYHLFQSKPPTVMICHICLNTVYYSFLVVPIYWEFT